MKDINCEYEKIIFLICMNDYLLYLFFIHAINTNKKNPIWGDIWNKDKKIILITNKP